MPLRGDAQRVRLVLPPGQTRPVLGTSTPVAESRRAATAAHWDAVPGPRQQPQDGGIVEPLSPRAQAALAHRVPAGVRETLARGRTDTQPVPASGVLADVPLDPPVDEA